MSTPESPAQHSLATVTALLTQVRGQTLDVSRFTGQAHSACGPALAALPPRYGEVWRNLLDRLDSSALFSEESCSFSQRDLLDSLQTWLDKAHSQLAASPSAP